MILLLALVALLGAPLSTPNDQRANYQASQNPKSQDAKAQSFPHLRFHHVHLKVADPASEMSALAKKVDGTRVIVQGLGVGVRIGDRFVLFDRLDESTRDANPVSDASDRYRRAAAWLAAHGLAIDPGDLGAPAVPDARVDHVAFVGADLPAVVEALRKAGVTPLRRSDDVATFSLGNGEIVEIVRETDRPDAFWCPMHLDVRSPDAGKCPACGMDLVRIPPLRLGEYRFELTATARELTLRVADPDGKPVTDFVTVHERPFHLFIISRDLSRFEHEHPQVVGGSPGVFKLRLPRPLPPGAYMAIADVLPYGATTQMLHKAFVTPGYKGPLFAEAPALKPGPAEAVADGVRVRIDADLAARKDGCITFTLSDASTGAPITDLEPFLGAPAHMLIVNRDLTDAIHVHPEEYDAAAATVLFAPLMPAPGTYKLWVQFQRKGKVTTAAFVVAVR